MLEVFKKSAGVAAVHLGVVKLEGDRERIPEELLFVSAQIKNRLLKMPVFILMAPSISVSVMAEVPITIAFFDMK